MISDPAEGVVWSGMDVLVVTPTPTHPQDQGNRKRMFELCAELRRQGARVHLLHYAADLDWRWRRPARAEATMTGAWSSYQLVLGSDRVHARPAGLDHSIDEWADPALLHHLRWTFRVRTYDTVIVAYTWLSYCFEAVPPGVFRILDTHDVFSARRALLETHGIDAEFFHTTPAEEARGLARADLVWAIKESERHFFGSQLAQRHCLTLLHSEPDRGWWREAPSVDRWLRVGIIGARNNINRRNLEAFLDVALPLIVNRMAPVRILIAGGCAQYFRDLRHPNVIVGGRIEDIAGFYGSVDMVCAPMAFSTGLKIKVAEALAAGVPLLAHQHAMDGYPSDEPRHLLPDFAAMALELVKLAFDPSGLEALARTSRRVNGYIQADFRAALEESRRRLCAAGAGGPCVLALLQSLQTGALLHEHLRAALDGLGAGATVNLFLTGPACDFDPATLSGLRCIVRVFIDPPLYQQLGAGVPETWTALALPDCLASRMITTLYCLADHPLLATPAAEPLRRIIVRHEAVMLSGACPEALLDRLTTRVEVIAVAGRLSALLHRHAQLAAIRELPFGCARPLARLFRSGDGHDPRLLILSGAADPLLPSLQELASRLRIAVEVRDVTDRASLQDIAGARLVVDVSQNSAIAAMLTEGALRAGIPVVQMLRGACAYAPRPGMEDAFPRSDGALLGAVARGLCDSGFRHAILARQAANLHQTAPVEVLWGELRRMARGLQAAPDV